MSMALLRTQPGMICPLPDGRTVGEEPMELDTTDLFIRRRIADGDLVPAAPMGAGAAPAATSPAAKE